jgi:FAD:protein FMN transferase
MPPTPSLLPLVGLLLLAPSCSTPSSVGPDSSPASGSPLERFEFTRIEMGMDFRIVLYTADRAHATTAATAAFNRIRALNAIFSDYEEDSELSQLSQSSGQDHPVPLSPDLWIVLERAQSLADQTEGAFDVTVGPYVSLWRRARRNRELPRPDFLERARASVGHPKLILDPQHRTATLTSPRMRLDLGGIAKGYAMDQALIVLRLHGVTSALVSGGGDIVASAPPPNQPGWRIALTPLDTPDAPPSEYALLSHRALSTSGDLFQHVVINNVRYSHIINPKTGIGLTDQSMVTVIARDSLTADSLATALSVLPPSQGLALLRKYPGTEARIARRPSTSTEVHSSKHFSRYLAPAHLKKPAH